MSAGLYAIPYNGTEGEADAGYSAGVADLNVFYEVSSSDTRRRPTTTTYLMHVVV